jgi:hypothetical protein
MPQKTIEVMAATGAQGGSVPRALFEGGWKVNTIARIFDSDAAKALAKEGASLIQADLDDESSGKEAVFIEATPEEYPNLWPTLLTSSPINLNLE